MAQIGWRDHKPGEKIVNMHTCKSQVPKSRAGLVRHSQSTGLATNQFRRRTGLLLCYAQAVFIRPEQYKDCMDLSLMLAWNAQVVRHFNSKPQQEQILSEPHTRVR